MSRVETGCRKYWESHSAGPDVRLRTYSLHSANPTRCDLRPTCLQGINSFLGVMPLADSRRSQETQQCQETPSPAFARRATGQRSCQPGTSTANLPAYVALAVPKSLDR